MPHKSSYEVINPNSIQTNEKCGLLAEMPVIVHIETKQIMNRFNCCQPTPLSNRFLSGFKIVTKSIYTQIEWK